MRAKSYGLRLENGLLRMELKPAPIFRAEQGLVGRPCAGSLRRDLDLRIDQP